MGEVIDLQSKKVIQEDIETTVLVAARKAVEDITAQHGTAVNLATGLMAMSELVCMLLEAKEISDSKKIHGIKVLFHRYYSGE